MACGDMRAGGSNQPALQDSDASGLTDEERCHHQIYCNGVCGTCGRNTKHASAVPLRYIQEGLMVGLEGMDQLRQAKLRSLCHRKKLCLVLDLDQTLLHAVNLLYLSEKEKYLTERAESLQDNPTGSLYWGVFRPKLNKLIKLRPYVRDFLEEASKMYEMHVYTMGDRPYALGLAKILDPDNKYFGFRVISREDCTEVAKKGLDVVIAPESAVVILDDKPGVWDKHKENLITITRYKYFRKNLFSCRGPSLAELKTDESETDGALARVLKDLKRLHQTFYSPDQPDTMKDIRRFLKESV